MIPYVITEEAKEIAEKYWGRSWTFLSIEQVEEALAALEDEEYEDRLYEEEW